MKNTKKNILMAAVLSALLFTSAYADGDMGSGGKTCPQGQTCLTSYDVPTKATRTPEGDMGSGGLYDGIETETYLDSVLRSIYAYFDWTM